MKNPPAVLISLCLQDLKFIKLRSAFFARYHAFRSHCLQLSCPHRKETIFSRDFLNFR